MMQLSEDELIETPDGAFLSAMTPNKLDEMELHPFCIMRQAVAFAMGIEMYNPKAGFWDAVIMVWLCTQDKKGVKQAKANPDKAVDDAFEWAEQRGYTMVSCKPLVDIYGKIMREIEASTKASLVSDGEPEKNSSGQPAI